MIYQKIREIINEDIDFSVPLQDFGTDLRLADIGVNSITFIKIVVAIETEFNIEFADEDLDFNKFPNIDFLVTYVKDKII